MAFVPPKRIKNMKKKIEEPALMEAIKFLLSKKGRKMLLKKVKEYRELSQREEK